MSLPANARYFKLLSHKTVTAALKSARMSKNLSGADAAKLINLTQPQLSKIENGRQAFFTEGTKGKMEELAKLLEVGPLKWTEADWREEERKPKVMAQSTVRVVPTVASKAARLEDQLRLVMDLYDAGALDRDALFNGLSKLLEAR